MKFFVATLLVLTYTLTFSQSQVFVPKLKVIPHLGIGWAIPPIVNGGNSNLVLKPDIFKNYIIGEITTSSGDKNQIYKLTNTLGIELNYSVAKQWSINVGVGRAMHIHRLTDPEPIRASATTQYSSWIFAYKYTSLLLGGRYNYYDRFFQCNIQYAGATKQAIESDNGSGGGVVTNGNGLTNTLIAYNSSSIIISPEYGISGVSSFNVPMELSVGLNIPTSVFSKEKVTFLRNGLNAGENILSFTQAALWLRVRIPITIWTKKEKLLKKAVEPRPTPLKTVEYEGKKIAMGEKIILKSLQFEQAKAVLSPNAMSELDKLQELMSQSPSMIIEIIGHTSNEGDRNSNIELSLNRAKACKEYLQRKGIKPNRIQVRGMGPDVPFSNTDKSQNRRVEMQIIRM